ncbi:MAG: sulfurtransferase [Cyanobacteria bacterium P01_C01_bin.69]
MEKAFHLVNVQWLSQHLADPNVVIIDTRFALATADQGRNQYAAGHIPGAYYLDLNKDLSSAVMQHGGRHPLPRWDAFVSRLNRMGIHSHRSEDETAQKSTQIVIYDDSRFAFAARLWWMLRYLGHKQVAILDGGIQAWKAAEQPLSTETPADKDGNFQPEPQPDWIVEREMLRQRKDLPNVVVIDSRSPERWRGEVEPIDPVAGSVAGSINSFWKDVTTEEGLLKSIDELTQHWRDIDSEDEVIVYCGSGVTACVNLFSLVMAGHPVYKLYPGGWSDWCSYFEGDA